MWLSILFGATGLYLLTTLVLTFLVLQLPRKPVKEQPDWGRTVDAQIPARDGGRLEVWRVEPEGHSRGVVLLAHGWGRNRDRMVGRARFFGKMGFTTIMHSARDHGGSSPHLFMNAPRFAEDIEAVMDWIGEPVILYGHSISAAASVIVAYRNPGRIKLLFLESCYARTRQALLSLYRNYHILFGLFFAPVVILWMELLFKRGLEKVSPVNLAPSIDLPVLIIHGEKDRNFPLHHAWRLRDSFPPGRAECFIVNEADHSGCSLSPAYPNALQAFLTRHLSL